MQQTDRNRIEDGKTVKVWDLFIRFFHWTLVLGCVTAFISGEVHASEIHVLTGYALCALLVARVYWGFKGRGYARFRSFIFPVSETLAYVRSMFGKHPCKHYFGHNPAGALMVFTLLGLLSSLLVTGLVTLAAIDFEGPLVFLANLLSDETSYAFHHVHEFLSTVGLVLVAFHLMGVVGGSIQHNENLVRAMVTGKKELPVSQKENGEY